MDVEALSFRQCILRECLLVYLELEQLPPIIVIALSCLSLVLAATITFRIHL